MIVSTHTFGRLPTLSQSNTNNFVLLRAVIIKIKTNFPHYFAKVELAITALVVSRGKALPVANVYT